MATAAKNVKQEKPAKTTYDTGKELENRVARMLKKRGHICIKQNQRVKDRNGNWSEFDIVYGWPVKHYVECKNYAQPVKLEMVAKFKEVLRLHRIPKSRGLFVTTSTYTPRATTIGITCIDGAGLERLEKTALTARLTKYLIVCICGAGSYALYWYLKNTESEKVNELKSTVGEKSHDVVASSVKTVKEVSGEAVSTVKEMSTEAVSTASEVVANARDVAQEKGGEIAANAAEAISSAKDTVQKKGSEMISSAADAISSVKDAIQEKTTESSPPEDSPVEEAEKTEEGEEWEAPGLLHIVSSIFWGLLGYSN